MNFAGTDRPPVKWHHATTHLDRFALISYRVDSEKLAAVLPAGIEPTVFTFLDGSAGSLVSAVPFLDRSFAFRFMPLIRLSCGQINYRAYVRVNGEDGVWFFGTSLDSRLVLIPQHLWKMPWHRDSVRISEDDDTAWHLDAKGEWGDATADLVPDGNAFDTLDGFSDVNDTARILTHPMSGWFRRTDGRLGKYTVWHDVFALTPMVVSNARFAVFERLGLTDETTQAHSGLMQRTIRFDVHTPPHAVEIS